MDTERKVEQQADHGLKKMTALQEKITEIQSGKFWKHTGQF